MKEKGGLQGSRGWCAHKARRKCRHKPSATDILQDGSSILPPQERVSPDVRGAHMQQQHPAAHPQRWQVSQKGLVNLGVACLWLPA